jgi:transcriptional regulator with XRE-family HTH domain
MTPSQLKQARLRLGLSLYDMATMLGYEGYQRRGMQHDLETGRRAIREPQRRLVEAYLAGYRPHDWPERVKIDANQTGP